jgi:undecaprenyl-diphosphatase
MKPFDPALMRRYPVSTRVNQVHNHDGLRKVAGTRSWSTSETIVVTPNNENTKRKEVKIGFSFLGALLIDVTALFVFGWLAEEVLEGDTQKFDAFVRNTVHQVATPGLTHLMQAFSVLGSVAVVATLSLLAICAFLYFHHARTAALLAITMVGAGGLDIGLKHAFHRARPVGFFGLSPSSYSFPSGHALGALCFYGALATILSTRARGRAAQFCIWIAATLLIAMIGFSRIYLGVHYPSDVIAGYCAAAVWIGMVFFLDRTLGLERSRRTIATS